MARPARDPKERFLEKVKRCDSGCHEWQSSMHRDGYGKFQWSGTKTMQSHRAAYLLFVGEIPEKMMVLHKCDNRKCVNLDHLYLGTAKQNVADKVQRCAWYGRMKYDQKTIEQCQKLYAEGMSQQKIADLLGVEQTGVSRFVRGKFNHRK